MVALEMRVYLV